ncbi:MupA/Atu3671 family FMN-dependent luciferase-like monooxygenase [Microbispora sp. NPDC046973]|uniref:MupA/Atu3671 family FMN-dependent luciferase-like monooxygenase n=1 Tax=Microbispora sp. NPDC046973 TaxID=3155022 RepID=UPI0033DA56CB
MKISLSYFAATEREKAGSAYRVLLDSARLADEAGLEAVWVPERHFSEFGSPYPNPSVVGAAVAAVTRRIGVRAGSVVLPLHHPARVAEEWAVVDQLSGGRVGVSFASGWHGTDFVLSRHDVDDRRRVMAEGIDVVRALWRGETRTFADVAGREFEVRTMPQPVQPELPTWVTAGGSPGTFELAGTLGAGVLTHLLGQRPEDLAQNVAAYRKAWEARGGGGRGHVTLMLHTHILDGLRASAERARVELARYLGVSMDLIQANAADANGSATLRSLSETDRDAVVRQGVTRFGQLGLVCTAAELPERLATVSSWDVDEVACLIDFGFDHESIMRSLDDLLTTLA